jgi:adenylosuccinate synthase
MPSDIQVLSECEPVYEVLPGWSSATTGVTSYKALPPEAKRYLGRIEELAACRIDVISTGSKRSETIMLRNPLGSVRRKSASA